MRRRRADRDPRSRRLCLRVGQGQCGVPQVRRGGLVPPVAHWRKRDDGKQADVFLANNVLAHVPDLNGFVEGIAILLKHNGVAVIEAPYVVNLVEHCEFDTIYHQHLCYFSVTALDKLFRRHSLYLNKIECFGYQKW